ncbi:MAG: hypothetical protein IGR76_07905 [Synechococcales cyanobacterium T60_A2020_003]|nr:hypothetical protein [Synechococcales cyanobacterium T60_A2020_003]
MLIRGNPVFPPDCVKARKAVAKSVEAGSLLKRLQVQTHLFWAAIPIERSPTEPY